MIIRLDTQKPFVRLRVDALILPVFQGEKELPCAVPAHVRQLVHAVQISKEFTGALFETHCILIPQGKRVMRLCLLGLGDRKQCMLEDLRKAAGAAVMRLKKTRVGSAAFWYRPDIVKGASIADCIERLALGTHLAAYHFVEYKKKKDAPSPALKTLTILCGKEDARAGSTAVTTAAHLAAAMAFVKDVGNLPPNVLTPAALAERSRTLAKTVPNVRVAVLEKRELEREHMGGVLGVGQGSQHEPRCIVLEYHGTTDRKPIALVGKAITFDSGGISIKPSPKMDEMKFDMCGGAAVIATVVAAAALKLPVHLVGIVCAAENVPSHTSYKPGDILRLGNGSTVEVLNTDAEGRIVVADGMIYSRRYKPETIVTVATLTGAIVVALADYATGLFTDDVALRNALMSAGEKAGELLWNMPMPAAWAEHLKSPIADIRNIPAAKIADASIGALFLKYFVEQKMRFAHLDIAGTAWQTNAVAYEEAGATGVGVRLFVEYLRQLSQFHESMKT